MQFDQIRCGHHGYRGVSAHALRDWRARCKRQRLTRRGLGWHFSRFVARPAHKRFIQQPKAAVEVETTSGEPLLWRAITDLRKAMSILHVLDDRRRRRQRRRSTTRSCDRDREAECEGCRHAGLRRPRLTAVPLTGYRPRLCKHFADPVARFLATGLSPGFSACLRIRGAASRLCGRGIISDVRAGCREAQDIVRLYMDRIRCRSWICAVRAWRSASFLLGSRAPYGAASRAARSALRWRLYPWAGGLLKDARAISLAVPAEISRGTVRPVEHFRPRQKRMPLCGSRAIS